MVISWTIIKTVFVFFYIRFGFSLLKRKELGWALESSYYLGRKKTKQKNVQT